MRKRMTAMGIGLTAAGSMIAVSLGLASVASADSCPPGHLNNEYTGQCYVQGSAPTINGIPCVASKTGLCSSFIQNQQPPRRPVSG